MKPAVTWLAALAACAYLGAMTYTGALPERRHLAKFEAKGLLVETPERVESVVVVAQGATHTFKRSAGRWQKQGQDVPAELGQALDSAVAFMHRSAPIRSIPLAELRGQNPSEFGLAPPALTIQLTVGGASVLEAGFGNTAPMTSLDYVGVVGRNEIYLLSHFVAEQWQKVLAAAK